MSGSADYSKNYFDSNEKRIGAYSAYDEERLGPAFEAMVQVLKNVLSVTHVLDIGCAKGFLVAVLRKFGYIAWGIDISEYALSQSPEFVKPFLHVGDLGREKLKHDNNSFDGIICMGTLEYIEDQRFAVDEIDRVLKKLGYLLITTLGHVPANDQYRVYAKSKDYWNAFFLERGYTPCHELAGKIFSAYVRKIIKYDLVKIFRPDAGQSQKFSAKARLAKLLHYVGFASLLESYLYNRQMRSGYLMLGYQK